MVIGDLQVRAKNNRGGAAHDMSHAMDLYREAAEIIQVAMAKMAYAEECDAAIEVLKSQEVHHARSV